MTKAIKAKKFSVKPSQPMAESSADKLAKSISIKFKDINILNKALVHRSYINENRERNLESNERLEYLGDAVLELVVSEFLFSKYPDIHEGDLTSFRAALVRTESIAFEALRLSFGDYILMSMGEEQTGGRRRPYILANTFEAVIGAIYLDSGYNTSKKFIVKNLCYKIDDIVQKRADIDSKSKLQEVAQETMKITPSYELIESIGPDHNKVFTMSVSLDGFKLAEGKGKSKQEAERDAAAKALAEWEKLAKEFKKSSNK